PGEAVRAFREHLLLRQRFAEANALEVHLEEPVDEAVEEVPTAEPAPQLRTQDLELTEVRMVYPDCDRRSYLLPGEPLDVHIRYHAGRVVDGPVFWMGIHDLEGRLLFAMNCEGAGLKLGTLVGDGEVVFKYPSVPLLDGTYLVSVGAHSPTGGTVYDHHDQ